MWAIITTGWQVALLAEGVDRNHDFQSYFPEVFQVALLAEGVDRNDLSEVYTLPVIVALLAEGVDRNSSNRIAASIRPSRPPRGGRG